MFNLHVPKNTLIPKIDSVKLSLTGLAQFQQ